MINVSQGTKIFLTFFIIFSFFSQYISWNEISRFSLTRSIIEKNTFDIDSFHTQTGDRVRFKGHYYTDKSPGLSFLATPIYASWKILFPTSYFENKAKENSDLEPLSYYVKEMEFTYNQNPSNFLLSSMFLVTVFTSSLFSALTVLLLYKISKHFTDDKKQIFLITFIYGLGTLAFPHALVFTSHAVETFFGFLSFYLLFKFKTVESKKRLLLLAGMCLGFGLTISYSALLLLVVCFIYLFSINRKKFIMIFLIGVVLGSLPLLVYNYSAFANPFEFIGRLEYIDTFSIPANLEKVYINPQSGFSSTLLNFLRLKSTLIPIILQILILPSKGLFFYYPVLVFSFIGLCYGYKKYKAEFIAILFLFILFLVIIPPQVLIWWGAFSGFGLRYMLPVIPFLMIPLLIVSRRINLKIVALAICFSIFANLLMLQYGEDTISLLGAGEYEEKLKNFQVLSNPLIDHYLPLFLKNGPRSILFENLILNKKIDIRLTPHSCGLTPAIIERSELPLFVFPQIGIISLNIPFLSLVPIIIIIFLIWRKEITKNLNLSLKEKSIVLIELIIIFSLLFVRITNFVYSENWYAPEFNDGEIDKGRWIGQNSTIKIFNRGAAVRKKLSFRIGVFNNEKNLQIYLNDNLVFENTIKEEMQLSPEIKLMPGLNEIRFNSASGCEIPTEIGLRDCDLRCLSFKIRDIQIVNGDKKSP